MRLRRTVALLWLPLLALLSLSCARDKKQPAIDKTEFDGVPFDIRYFDDSETVLAFVRDPDNFIKPTGVLWRSDDAGGKWQEVDDVGTISLFWMHPHDKKKAYALSSGNKHWYTNDRGKKWSEFKLEDDYRWNSNREPFSFHGTDSNKVIFNTETCKFGPFLCTESAHYTTDGFKSVQILRTEGHSCIFAHATPLEHNDGKHEDRVLCLVTDKTADGTRPRVEDQRLYISDDFFKTEHQPSLDSKNGRTVAGIVNMADVKGYLLAAQKSKDTQQLNLYVSLDGEHWNLTQFPSGHKLQEKAYTVLESTNYSVQVNVLSDPLVPNMGTMFTSNSDGVYFSENIPYVNRNSRGYVDFEKVQGIQGIIMVNIVANAAEVLDKGAGKQLQSQISFDDGRTFEDLAVVDDDGKPSKTALHVHSVTEPRNIGRVFSGPAPGILMAVGNTGSSLKSYQDGDLFVSDDAGRTWRRALDDAHKYEFGDQGGIMVAVPDEGSTNEIRYNLQHGKGDWETVELEDKVKAEVLTTLPDATSLSFILVAKAGRKYQIYKIDFADLDLKSCSKDDFEQWAARKDDEGEPSCLMGHTETYRRRKADAMCLVGHEFDEPEVIRKNCECTKEDFECDHDFRKNDDGECVPTSSFKPPSDACKDGKDGKFEGPSGYRKIPGNTCEGGASLDKDKKNWDCDNLEAPPPGKSGNLTVTPFEFKKSKAFVEKIYLEKGESASGTDAVIARTYRGDVWRTTDHGKTWIKLDFGDDQIYGMIKHQHDNERVFFLTRQRRVYYSVDRGENIKSFDAPTRPPVFEWGLMPLRFHEKEVARLIWTGEKNGFPVSYYSPDQGSEWQLLVENCRKCEFIKEASSGRNDQLIYCEQYTDKSLTSPIKLLSSSDWFKDNVTDVFPDIVAFATMSEFIIVLNKDEDDNLKIDASVNGQNFADAKFPKNFRVPHQTAYTLLDSSTHSVFLEVTESDLEGFEYGRLMKSNSNGTFYVLSIANVNQNTAGYVDFEKMQGLEGVAMVNVVANADEDDKRDRKILKTMITHNDGAEWTLMRHVLDVDGKPFENCGAKDYGCSLHIHGYTERADPSDTYSSPSAIGLMLANGNIGDRLKDDDESSTFVTRDAGISWHRIKDGKHMWEFGDQGSIIAIVKDGHDKTQTDEISYSLDQGKTWVSQKFSDSKVLVTDLTTVPSDSATSFIVWGTDEHGSLFTWNIDFDGIYDRLCDAPEDKGGDERDYEEFKPQHPFSEKSCLFGHVTSYHRKKGDAQCWNGRGVTEHHQSDQEICDCGREDYECDYNYQFSESDQTCQHVPGTETIDPADQCKEDPKLEAYFESKGYRKVPISNCKQNENSRKYHGEMVPCPNFRKDYEKKHGGLHGFPLFLVAFVLPVLAAGGIGYFVWSHWDSKFGQIRLGDGGSAFDADQPWIRWPVAALSGLVAVLAAVPLVVGASWRALRGLFGGSRRYTTRDSFARGRGDYVGIDPDEDELLGGEDEEEL